MFYDFFSGKYFAPKDIFKKLTIFIVLKIMIMFNLTSVPSDLHAHPPCKVDSRAEERARRMLPQVKILDQTT